MKRILFVCTGNTCRSPMAEGIFGTMASREGLKVEIRSAGVGAIDGSPISGQASKLLREKGFQDVLTSSALTEQSIDWADLVLTMTMSHKQHVIQRYPQSVDKVFTLKEYVEDDPNVILGWADREKFIGDIQVKLALSQPLTEEENKKLQEMETNGPDFDILDPFGGDEQTYRQCAEEIEACLDKLVRKNKNGQ